MSALAWWPALTVLALGAWHGVNPGMGWLFAVALGLQERERRAVWLALVPLAAGHALAVAAALGIAFLLGGVLPAGMLKWTVAVALVGTGVSRLLRNRHPRYGGMRMTMRTLTVWSFLMASAHGAGLMVLPFALRGRSDGSATMMSGTRGLGSSPAGGRTRERASEPRGDQAVAGKPALAGPVHLREAGRASEAARRSVDRARDIDGHVARAPAARPGNPTSGVLVLLTHTLGFLFATGLIAVIVYERLGLRFLRSVWVNLDLVWGSALIATGLLTPVIS